MRRKASTQAFLLKIRQTRVPSLIVIGYLIFGTIYFQLTYPTSTAIEILLYVLAADLPPDPSPFTKIYAVLWSIVIAQAVLGFIVSAFFEEYNPIITSKLLAKSSRNHTIIIHYNHLAHRIIDHLRKLNRPFAIIEDEQELLEDLINDGQPAIIGDPIEITNLNAVGVKRCKEVFIVSNDPEESVVSTNRIRQLNPKCPIYVRVFDDKIADFLQRNPLNAKTFSTTQWTMNKLLKVCEEGDKKPALIFGFDNLSQRLIEYLTNKCKRLVYLIDEKVDPQRFAMNRSLKVIQINGTIFTLIEQSIPLKEIGQVFVCWNDDLLFTDTLNITSHFTDLYPNIRLFVRIFNEELKEFMDRMKIQTFSSSAYAFKMLQKEVEPNSNIVENSPD